MPTATATESEPTHDLTLYDGTNTYGFILCDANGNPNPFAIDRSPTNRTSIKMSQGSSKYDDLQGPHLSLVQQDWSGGRGLEDFGDDSSRFFDSYRANTWMPGRVILGPQETYGTGYRDQDNVMPGSVSWTALYGATRYLANKFTATSYDADKCYIWLRKVGTPNALTLELCSDTSGDPGVVRKTVTLAAASVTDVASLFKAFDWTTTYTLSAASFHIKVYSAATSGSTLLTNGGFETAGTGGADVWGTWTETAGGGTLANEITIIHEGVDAAKVSYDGSGDTPVLRQDFTSVPGKSYRLRLWTRGDATVANQYRIYDDSNGADIVAKVTTGVTAATWTAVVKEFTAPAGCTAIGILLYGPAASGDTYFDACEVHSAVDDDDATNHWEVGTNASTGTTQKSSVDANWAEATGVDLYFRIVDADDSWVAHFYDYKGQMYFVTAPDDATAPEVFINGDRGAADANTGALTTLVDGTKSWTTNEWADSVAVITAGPGYRDELNWRVIASNTSDTLTVSSAWATEHTTSTEYVIIASNKFTAQAGHGLTKPVTDVLISKDVIYYAQGDGVAMRRHYEYNNSGTWTPANWDDEGGATYAKFLKVIEDPVNGAQVWKANDSASSEPSVARATAQAWGTDLTFGTAIVVGNRNERMTGLEAYGDPSTLWVLKEGSMWDVANDIPNEKPLREMKAVASFKNGRAHLVQGVYLYFSLLHSLQRYFRNNLDDVGPWAGTGLPADRQGVIYHMQGYPAFFLCALDGGASNYSSILLSMGHGDWHEFYRAPEVGQRIRRLHMQVIPGSTIDRLWVSMGTDVLWLPMPSDTLDPYRDSNYRFTHEGHVISAWHYANMQDVTKFWNSLKVFAENLTASEQTIEAEYQTDGDIETDTWTALNGTFDTVPVEEVGFISTNNLTARRLRYRLRFLTTDNTKTPKMKAALIEALGRVAPKWQYSFTFRAKDENLDREGDDDSYTAVETLITQVDTWSASAVPLTMRCLYSPFDNKTVFAEAAPMRPYLVTPDEQSESHISQMVVYEK